MGFDRYKYVVSVLIVEKAGQAIHVSKQIILNTFCKLKVIFRSVCYLLGINPHTAV